MGKLYSIVEGDELFNIPEDSKRYLIDGVLGERDHIVIVAEPKMGKTILAQQMACSLTSGEDFLGIYKVRKPVNVWYFATEGRDDDLRDRFIRINKMVRLDTNKLKLIPCNFRFNTSVGLKCLDEIKAVLADSPPGLIIIDALYRAIMGSLIKDDVINEYYHVIGLIQSEFQCAATTIHHMRKPSKDPSTNKPYDMNDRDMYGSTFILGGVDHCIWIEDYKKSKDKFDKVLRCDSQRSGNVGLDGLRIRLNQPDPLGFTVLSRYKEEKERIIDLLRIYKAGMSINELGKKLDRGSSTLYVVKKEMDDDGLLEYVKREGGRELIWKLKKP